MAFSKPLTRRLGPLFAVALVVAACGAEQDAGAGSETSTTSAATSTTTPRSGLKALQTELGLILTTSEGFTLYVFSNDSDSTSTCIDSCALTWPPAAPVKVGETLDASLFSTISRPDGSSQLAVLGMPLYRFAGDQAPGDINGHELNDVWFAVGADGRPIVKSGITQPADDYGYDY